MVSKSLRVISSFHWLMFSTLLPGKKSSRLCSRDSMCPSSMAIPISVDTTLLVQE